MTLVPQRVNAPIKGWNSITPVREMGHEFAVKLENVWLDQAQAMNRRPCQTPLSTTAPTTGQKIKHMFEHRNITGASKFFVWVNGVIKEWTSPTWTTDDSTFSSRIRSANMGNLLTVGDGVNPAKKFNGTAWSLVTTTPTPVGASYIGNIFHTHKGRVYAAGDPAQQMTIYYSDVVSLLGSDYWSQSLSSSSQGGFIDISGSIPDGDVITGITSYKGFLVVLLRNHIIFYSGNDPLDSAGLVVAKVIRGIGCLAHDSIQGIGNNTVFLSQYGFKTLEQIAVQGDAAANDTSVPINNFVIDEIEKGNAVAADIRSEFVEKWGVYVCTFGNVTLAYHVFFDAWVAWYGVQPQLLSLVDGTVYTADEWVHTMSTSTLGDTIGTGSQVAAPMVWELPPFRASGDEVKARWNRIELIFESKSGETINVQTWTNLDVSQEVNESVTLLPDTLVKNSTGMIWSAAASTDPRRKWGGGAGFNPTWAGSSNFFSGDQRIPVIGRAELFSARISNSNISRFKIIAFEVYTNEGNIR